MTGVVRCGLQGGRVTCPYQRHDAAPMEFSDVPIPVATVAESAAEETEAERLLELDELRKQLRFQTALVESLMSITGRQLVKIIDLEASRPVREFHRTEST